MALKRVCDITGTDSDVEICDVTIAGQALKLDLSPAGAQKLREFFGPVVTVQHPAQDVVAAANGNVSSSAASQDTQSEGAGEAEEEPGLLEEAGAGDDPDLLEQAETETKTESAAAERPARRGRRTAAAAKSGPKKTLRGQKKPAKNSVSRRAVASDVPDTSEIREWARANGFEIGERGAIPGRIRSAYTLAHE